MSDSNARFRVAAVQAAPVYLDREATLLKACRLIEEAGHNGGRLVAFPEVYIPGYPYWVRYMDPLKARKYTKELIEQAVRIPQPSYRSPRPSGTEGQRLRGHWPQRARSLQHRHYL